MFAIAGSSNGRTHASGAWYLGSNPGPAAMRANKKYSLSKEYFCALLRD